VEGSRWRGTVVADGWLGAIGARARSDPERDRKKSRRCRRLKS
jgi:hypothetical protein